MTTRILEAAVGAVLAAVAVVGVPRPGHAEPVDLKLFAPAREAAKAIQAAYKARAAELAPRDLRLAEEYYDDGTAMLRPPRGPPDIPNATHRFYLAGAQARVAETRAVEVIRRREAAGAGNQFLDAIEPDPLRILPPRPSIPQAAGDYRVRRQEAARATAARQAAEEAAERLRREEG